MIFRVNGYDIGMRLDKFISCKSNMSRNLVQKLIKSGNVKSYNNVRTFNNYTVRESDVFKVNLSVEQSTEVETDNIPLNIIFEDDFILIIDKPHGLVVHSGAGTKNNTLANALVNYYSGSLPVISGKERPGLVHRLDKDTSGIMVIAKNEQSYYSLFQQFSSHQVAKEYLAVVWGYPTFTRGIINNKIGTKKHNKKVMTVVKFGGKLAITEYRLQQKLNGASLVKCIPKTGRTHQIRVHLSHMGNSIVGDQIYGKNSSKAVRYASDFIYNFKRQALHACRLGFFHPSNNLYVEFASNIPDDLQTLIKKFS